MFKRKYECFFILEPELSEENMAGVGDKLKGVVESNGGTVVSYVPWGKKKLAYPVKKRHYGHYVLMEFASDPALVMELERNMRLDERVLKFITVKVDEKWDPEKEASAPKSAPVLSDEEEEASREESEEGEAYEGEEEEEEEEE
jgi:small subunit ribosomal protein S6